MSTKRGRIDLDRILGLVGILRFDQSARADCEGIV